MQFAVKDRVERRNPGFLPHLPDGGGQWRLAGLDLATGPVDLARTDAAFFADQQELALLEDVAERRLLFGHGRRHRSRF